MLDNLKAPIELVKHRADYYRFTIASLLRAVGISTELKNLTFVLGSSYQKSPEYVLDVYKLSSCITEHEARRAGAEVVKQTSNPPISGLLYPILQVVSMTDCCITIECANDAQLDEQYLDVDAQFGGEFQSRGAKCLCKLIGIGVDQRKLFIAAKEWLPRLGYREVKLPYTKQYRQLTMAQRAHLMNPMVPGLHSGKMSSSDPGKACGYGSYYGRANLVKTAKLTSWKPQTA